MPNKETLSSQSSLLLYQTEDGKQRIEVRLEGETVWLTQRQMSELFLTTPENITIHLKNIFSEEELDQNSVTKESLVTARDGKKYKTKLYRLEAIIAVGYRIQSNRGTQFRQWATRRLEEYIVKGFILLGFKTEFKQVSLLFYRKDNQGKERDQEKIGGQTSHAKALLWMLG